MASRRDFLKGASLLTVGGMLVPELAFSAPAVKKNKAAKGKTLGLQTYSLGPELNKDGKMAEVLVKLHDAGYTELELAGYDGNGKVSGVPMAEYKKMVDDAGLRVMSSHMNPRLDRGEKYGKETLSKISDFWKKACDDHAVFEMPYIVQPGLPGINSLEDAQAVAEVFNVAGEISKKYGMQWGYHNHDREFGRVTPGGDRVNTDHHARNGRQIEEVFITETDADKVAIELDVYWTVMGGQDPVEWIDKYPARIQLLHIKDRLVLGQSGMMNFEQIFKHFYANGQKTYFVEVEDIGSGHQMERVQASAQYLISSSFVK